MSFLSILIFASAFYFARGRPDAVADASPLAQSNPSEGTNNPLIPTQEQINDFVNDMTQVVEKYMTPIVSKLSADEQENVKNILLNEIWGSCNYMMVLILDKNSDKLTEKSYNNYLTDRDSIVFEFDSTDISPINSGFISALPDPSDVNDDSPLDESYAESESQPGGTSYAESESTSGGTTYAESKSTSGGTTYAESESSSGGTTYAKSESQSTSGVHGKSTVKTVARSGGRRVTTSVEVDE